MTAETTKPGEKRDRPNREVIYDTFLNEAVLPGSADKVYELVIDLVLTTEAEQLGQWLIEEWVVKRLSRKDMERVIGELLVVNEGLG